MDIRFDDADERRHLLMGLMRQPWTGFTTADGMYFY